MPEMLVGGWVRCLSRKNVRPPSPSIDLQIHFLLYITIYFGWEGGGGTDNHVIWIKSLPLLGTDRMLMWSFLSNRKYQIIELKCPSPFTHRCLSPLCYKCPSPFTFRCLPHLCHLLPSDVCPARVCHLLPSDVCPPCVTNVRHLLPSDVCPTCVTVYLQMSVPHVFNLRSLSPLSI
jgi:hypothetical protein